ncbi:gamma-glutamylcyclotransferase [Aquincola sp. S2]|uniref:Gamma-glutamylcyclotransferase family protein n=2 Tax=Pseudaquabacterium terrae TaxID=2732868 RepID=A0ABX2EFE0_9BURK|nr:gamma-glutamylcyclotransferase [Aquabacterium terrae]
MVTPVFVFGTLKEGFPNFGTNAGTRMAGSFVTVQSYPLYLVGERHSPWMIDAPGQGHNVVGQVFEVDRAALARMDALERVNEPDGYRRVPIAVRSRSSSADAGITVHAYLKQRQHLADAAIMAGPLPEYLLEHAALYRRRAP